MSGICDTCKRNQVCRKPIGGVDSCRLYVSAKESNYQRLFGTPERAARTLADIACGGEGCEGCLIYGAHCTYDGAAQLEWLKGDAD